jgi:hypothetical protein
MNNDRKDNSTDGQKQGAISCHAMFLDQSKLVECNTKIHTCRWRVRFGEERFCEHPSREMIAEGVLQTGWAL